MTAPSQPDTPAGVATSLLPDPRRWLALAVIAVAQLMVVLDASVVTIALPQAQRDLHISNADRQWVVTAYTVAFGGLLLLGGRIADYGGRKRVFVIGLIGFAAASAFGGVAQDALMLYAARGLQGAFAAILTPAALSLITVTFTEPRERARAFGVYGAISGGGVAIGLIVGGVLTDYASWRWCLLINVFIAIPAALAAVGLVSESKAPGQHHYDVPGAILGTAGLALLVFGFTEAAKPGVGWLAANTLVLIATAVALLIAFVVTELRIKHPLLPMRVVLDRNRGGSFLTSLLFTSGLFAIFLFLSYYFQINLGYSPLKSGLAFLPFSAGLTVSAAVASQLLVRLGPKPLMLAGGVLSAAGMLMLLLISATTGWTDLVLPSELVMSVGVGAVVVPLASLSLVGVEDRDAGVASAFLNATQQIGSSLGTSLLNTLYASAVSSYLAAHAVTAGSRDTQFGAYLHGYHVTFGVAAGLLVAAVLSTAVLINVNRTDFSAQQQAMAAAH